MLPTPIRILSTATVLLLAVAGCGDRTPPPPDMSEVFANLPLPPQARLVSRSGGEDALQLTMLSAVPQATVETYYLSVLNQDGWRLVSRTRDADGTLVLLAEQDGPPLWVRIRGAQDTTETLVELFGARPSEAAKPAS